jgi:hypothetical protein
VITALPTFAMSTLKIHDTVIEQMEKYRRHCIWRGSDLDSKKPAKADWNTVRRPKEGGRGVLNLKTHNEALLLKFLHKFLNREDIPCVNLIWECYYRDGIIHSNNRKGSFWWRNILQLVDKFKGMASVQIQDEKTCLLWEDQWEQGIKKLEFPELYSFTKQKDITVHEAKSLEAFQRNFHLRLSEEAYEQFRKLSESLDNITLQEAKDSWVYIWNSNTFSCRKSYKQLSGHLPALLVFSWLWKCSCQNKHKSFFWLLLKDRLSTRELLRRNMELPSYNCVL